MIYIKNIILAFLIPAISALIGKFVFADAGSYAGFQGFMAGVIAVFLYIPFGIFGIIFEVCVIAIYKIWGMSEVLIFLIISFIILSIMQLTAQVERSKQRAKRDAYLAGKYDNSGYDE